MNETEYLDANSAWFEHEERDASGFGEPAGKTTISNETVLKGSAPRSRVLGAEIINFLDAEIPRLLGSECDLDRGWGFGYAQIKAMIINGDFDL